MLNKDPSKRPTAKEILKMGFIKKRMLSYLQEKKFNFKDSFNLIQNYQKKKYKKFSSNNVNNNIDRKNMNNLNIKYNINFNEVSDKKGLSNTSNKKLRFINSKNPNININTINDNSHIKYKFNLKSDKEINKNLLNERYKFMDEKGDNNDKESGKDKFNNFRHSVQVPEKRNKINISKTKIPNGAIGPFNQEDKKVKIKELTASHQNYSKNIKFNLLKNDKKRDIYEINNSPYEKNVKITVNDFNDTNNLNDKDKDKYDFHRQMNIYSSLIRGEKTDEQIEEENNILLKNYD
jgi:hypothetical protein